MYMDQVMKVYRNYVGFTGRADRKEFWYFILFYVIVSAVLQILDRVAFGGPQIIDSGRHWVASHDFQPLTAIFAVISLCPSIAVTMRRLHDTGKSGWWVLIGLIPLIGWIWLLVLCAAKGDPSPNGHGEPPEGSRAA